MAAHRPSGLGVGSASQTNNRKLPGAWNVGGFFLYGVGRMCPLVWLPCEFSCQREQRQACLTMPSAAENALREMEEVRAASRHRRLGKASGGFFAEQSAKGDDGLTAERSGAVKESLRVQVKPERPTP